MPRTDQTALLQYRDISLAFNGRVIMQDFNLSIGTGEKVVLLGPSGSGKSSLLKLVIDGRPPAKGAVYCQGTKITPRLSWEVRRTVAYVPQTPPQYEQTPRRLIVESMGFMANRHLDAPEQRLDELCADFEFAPALLDQSLNKLSGGERQRFSLILALLLDRPILLLDEPTAALDGKLKEKIARYFLDLPEKTVLAVSHDPAWSQEKSRVRAIERKEPR